MWSGGDGTRSVIWYEEHPNSVLTCPALGLYKGEESNRATLSYIMFAVDSEVDILDKNYIEIIPPALERLIFLM